uniref:NADH-ubiquinone oxidoreductase chain 4L n=2 Tax=Gekkota TaxID=8560 RepID=A0A0C5A0K8_9SAUR|nr:NADH dehydrogenase subunit 4L [Hemidactylus bowringii]AIY32704.1 NADH dehydrogenase subunit 4L [Teratoscincus roborowskii]AIY61206.1 NADH dehydrogenase subunit 4L [Hemidactylus bowringii]AJJ48359.1 NADH dehydrogenase subunit 4L [Teratoscincus roborowskii]
MTLLMACTLTFALGLLGLALHRTHLVSALLCLEGLMLAMFTTMAALPQTMSTTTATVHPILMLSLAACEAGVGLALLVATTRAYASDNLKNLNLLAC